MGPSTGHSDEDESERLAASYAGYRRSRRKRRAWAPDNRGNVAMRDELAEAVWTLAGPDLRRVAREPGSTVLDAGCGNGYWLGNLLESGVPSARLHGVDLLDRRLAACRQRLPADARLSRADIRSLPFRSSTFDVVLLFTVLSSLASRGDAHKALAEARRVIRPGGIALIYEPRFPDPFNRNATRVPASLIRDALGKTDSRSLTVWPPLARRLGRFTPRVYPQLARWRWATSHRLILYRHEPQSRGELGSRR